MKHSEMVRLLRKHPTTILDALTPDVVDVMHACVGIAGEAGELLDAAKKQFAYGQQIDQENVIEELGDLEFYMEQLRQALGIARAATLRANKKKLAQRYPNFNYSDRAAKRRADKA